MFYAQQSANAPFIICPWDLDASWGRNWDSTYLSPRGIQSNLYFERLIELNVNDFNNRMHNKWTDLRTELITHGQLYERFRENADILIKSGAIKREEFIWPEMHLILESELQYLDPWIDQRIDALDEHFSSLP